MPIYNDNSLSIGGTPLVRLNRITRGAAGAVLVKVEGRNPAYSVKCRTGANMVWDAEKRGILKPGCELVEPTSGNTGIALAFVAAARGYAITLTMPEDMSLERRKVLKALGARLELTPAAEGMMGAVRRAEAMYASDPKHYVLLQQFRNPANPDIHFRTTGPEIWRDTAGEVHAFVSAVGTGGTLTGVARYLKSVSSSPVLAVAVEPSTSAVITQHMAKETLRPGGHHIQGIGAGFIPETLDVSLIDLVETVSSEEAVEMSRRLAREEGILAGISSGAAVCAAVRLANRDQFEDKNVVALLPDAAERYLSGILFEDIAVNRFACRLE